MTGNKNRHEFYELLNLLGYGLAKFDQQFVQSFGFKSKSSFYQYIIRLGICDTVGTIKNRQDMLDPFFNNGRSGWWQKSEQYISRKLFIDNLFGNKDVNEFSGIVKLYIEKELNIELDLNKKISPVLSSMFKQLQLTGQEAELYFISNFEHINSFKGGLIEDARLFGDGYDFQIENKSNFYLAEVKGITTDKGAIRMTENEFQKAIEYENDYILVVISNLRKKPKITSIENPVKNLKLKKNIITSKQINYNSLNLKW